MVKQVIRRREPQDLPEWTRRVEAMNRCRDPDELIERFGVPSHIHVEAGHEILHYPVGIAGGMLYSIHVAVSPRQPPMASLHVEPTHLTDTPAQRRDYTLRHALILSALVLAGMSAWVLWCLSMGLPFHPWSSVAIAVLVLATFFLFTGLDPVGLRLTRWLWNGACILILVCVGLAAIFSTPGQPFPLWALMPLLLAGAVIALLIVFFGAKQMLHCSRLRILGIIPPARAVPRIERNTASQSMSICEICGYSSGSARLRDVHERRGVPHGSLPDCYSA